jgi:hypothetical protein
LAALRDPDPSEATQQAYAAALEKLGNYEHALGITCNPSKPIRERLAAVLAAAEDVVTEALPAPLTKGQRSYLSLNALRQENATLATALGRVATLQAAVSDSFKPELDRAAVATAMSTVAALSPEARAEFIDNFLCSLTRRELQAGRSQTAEQLLKKLGVDGYVYDWSRNIPGLYTKSDWGLSLENDRRAANDWE